MARSASAASQHLAGEYFAQVTGTKLTHVPYRNIAQYGPDLIAGTVPLGFQWFPNVSAPIQGGGAMALGVAGDATARGIARCADHDRSRPARIQDLRLVRAGGAGRHAAADPRAPEQGIDRGAEGPRGPRGLRQGGRRADGALARPAHEFHADEIVLYRDIITKAGIARIE